PAVAVEPRDRPLHHPTPRPPPPPRDRLVPLDDLQQPTAPPPQPVDQLPRITPIRPDQADIGAFGPRALEDQLGPIQILDVRRRDHDAEQEAHGLDQQRPLGPLDLLAGIVTAAAAGPAPLDRSAIDEGGRRFVLLALSSPDLLAQGVEDPLPDPVRHQAWN